MTLTRARSPHRVSDTIERLVAAIEKRGITVSTIRSPTSRNAGNRGPEWLRIKFG
jgi:uncharacterized protein (DUF302 family)